MGQAEIKFENWHRFYDPASGRYLQPEPLLGGGGRTKLGEADDSDSRLAKWTSPEAGQFAMVSAAMGNATPVYSYAQSNPVGWVDPDGLQGQKMCGDCSCVEDECGKLKCSCKGQKPCGEPKKPDELIKKAKPSGSKAPAPKQPTK